MILIFFSPSPLSHNLVTEQQNDKIDMSSKHSSGKKDVGEEEEEEEDSKVITCFSDDEEEEEEEEAWSKNPKKKEESKKCWDDEDSMDSPYSSNVRMAIYWTSIAHPIQYFCDHPLLGEYRNAHVNPGFISETTAERMFALLATTKSEKDKYWRLRHIPDVSDEKFRASIFSDFIWVFGRPLQEGDSINSSAQVVALDLPIL